VRRYRDPDSYWQFIKRKFGTYAERREFLWESFRPLLEHLETAAQNRRPAPLSLFFLT
jgi:hypothetical protein